MRKLAVQKRGGCAAHFSRLRAVFALCDLVGGRCNFDKAARENAIGEDKQYGNGKGRVKHRQPAACAAVADDVQDICRAHELFADGHGVQDKLLDKIIGVKAHKVVKAEENKRDDNDDERLAFEMNAHPRDHPAEQAGEDENENAHKDRKQDAAENSGECGLCDDEINNDRRKHDNGAEHKPHEVHAHKTRQENVLRRHGQREHKVVVLCLVKT